MPTFISHSDSATIAWGRQFASTLKGGDIVALYGELGAGKTTLVKGIAAGLEIKEDISSPTFTLLNIFPIHHNSYPPDSPTAEPWRAGKLRAKTFVHIDTYRLKNEQEIIDIGVEDYLGQPTTITIIEWPEKIEHLLKGKKIIKIHLEHQENERRKITVNDEIRIRLRQCRRMAD